MKYQSPNHLRVVYSLCAAASLSSLSVGCAPEAELVYVSRKEVLENLAELHQQQLNDALQTHFGTPRNPWLRVRAEDAPTDDPQLVDRIAQNQKRLERGAHVYQRRCAGCHGITGDGNGEAAPFLNPKPRDYRRGLFKFISTPRGVKPRRDDLIRTVRRGAKGTSMPSFPWLPEEDVQAVVDYVILLSFRGEVEFLMSFEVADEYDPDQDIDPLHFTEVIERVAASWDGAAAQTILPTTAQPPYNEASIELGRQAFQAQACAKCHGTDGKGQTEWLSPAFLAEQEALPEEQRIALNRDDWGQIAPAADLTAGMLHGGRRPIDVYRRIHAGINGTPMPAFSNAFQDNPETIWHLTHFILSIVEGREFEPVEPTETPQ